eukprot:6976027-Prymnesium_polylepis.1
MHQAGASTARGSVMQGSRMGEGGVGAPRARRQAGRAYARPLCVCARAPASGCATPERALPSRGPHF